MEAAGLAVGVIALASLFKDCVDLFQYISTARSAGRDYEILDTMLDVEKTIFLQWAERVRLLEEDHHPLLDEPKIRMTVFRVLLAKQGLLSNGRDLQQRYGLRAAAEDELTNVVPVISGHRMTSFVRNFEAMSLRKGKRREVSIRQMFGWVVQDKEKFDELLRKLSYFNSKLNDMIPDTQQRVVLMVQRDIQDLRSLHKMRLVLEATTSREETIAGLAQQMITEDCQRRVLQTLWYRTMDLRKDQVPVAHSKTFRWTLEQKWSHLDSDNLGTWLEQGHGLYWVSGKAGSGKSTLMKYIYEHRRTHELLRIWSGDMTLTTASFFFWSLGLTDQRSQQGLLRALLYNVLHSEPSLIPDLLPNMWREAQASDSHKISVPSPVEMEAAFKRLSLDSNNKHKYCFFIDGLDEFAGRYENTIAFLNGLIENLNFKIVVSSRPIPSCVEAFSKTPKLRLQDLTRSDIESYVCATIGSHKYMATLMQGASQIIFDIVEKASGVFLWVVLACRSVLEGFAAHDHLSDIQQRIDELPPELHDLFSHILDKIETRYRIQAVKILRLCYEHRLSNDTEPLQTLGLAVIDDGKMKTDQLHFTPRVTYIEAKAKCEALEGRLRSRCCGFVEIRRASQASLQDGDGACFCQAQPQRGHDTLVDSTIEFMHRTVFEFLDQAEVWNLDCLQMNDNCFDATATLAHLSLELTHFSLEVDEDMARRYFKDVMLYGRRADASAPDLMAPVLFKLEDILTIGLSQYNSIFLDIQRLRSGTLQKEDGRSHFAFLFALEAGMVNFASSYTNLMNLSSLPDFGRPLLYHVLCGHLTEILCAYTRVVPTSTLRYLLESGCDPNEEFLLHNHSIKQTPWKQTPWKHWLNQMACVDVDSAIITAEVTEIFLRYNANPAIVEDCIGETLSHKVRRLLVDFGTGIGIASKLSVKDRRCVSEMGCRLLRLLEWPADKKHELHDPADGLQPPRKHSRPSMPSDDL